MELPGRKANTFTDILLRVASTHGDRRAYVFLRDGEDEEAVLTFRQLHERAQAVAQNLSTTCRAGDCALMLYPPGLDFIISFFGCLYAGVIPVPVTVPNRQRGFDILRGIAIDSGARCILSSTSLLAKFDKVLAADPGLHMLRRFNTEEWSVTPPTGWVPTPSKPNDVALLQYTSGSTGTPRGVMVTHANLIDNHRQLEQNFVHDQHTVVMSWLPMFHDMGLGTVLQATYLGVPCTLMAPTAFLQKPVRWLRAISRYRATSSGGPDFAYDLCVRRIPKEECAGLDLSSWRVAYNGSEPVRASTLGRFAAQFAQHGFRQDAFHPVYGLAEATLFVSGEDARKAPIVSKFSREGLERGEGREDPTDKGQTLVSCGAAWLDGRIRIVNPDTRESSAPGQIGEIWVGGPSVAGGYWKKPAETAEVFQARTVDGDGPFLRTGDLGFLHDGHLFVTGRSKDLIIVRGRNHYPQDIEVSVSESHPAVEPLACAAFSVESEDGEQLVIVQEVKRSAVHRLEPEVLFRSIRNVVADHHGVHTHAIVLLSPGTLPRTTSGKVRRKECRRGFLNQSLSALASSVFGAESLEANVETNAQGEAKVMPAIPGKGPAHSLEISAEARLNDELATQAADKLIDWLRHYADGSQEPQGSDVLRALSPSLMRDFAQQGLFGMQVGERYGGLGLGHCETARVLEQLSAIDLNAGLFVGLNNYLGVGPVARHGTSRLKDTLLPRLTRGGDLAGFAFSEPGGGSNPDALAAYAEPVNGSGWRLFGKKYSSGALQGKGIVNVFVRHADREGVTAFVVPQDTMGVDHSETALTHGTQGLARNRLSLDGVTLGHDHVLGRPGEGMGIALDAMAHARLAVAAACLGGMKRCAQLVFHYSTQRQTGTGRLVAHPVTLAKLGRVTAGITALECLVQQVARAADSGRPVPAEAFTVCKVAAPEMLWQVVDDLVQLLGRRGYVETPHIRNLVRDAHALRSCEGPTEAVSSLLGARLMSGGDEAITRLVAEILRAPSVAPLITQALDAVRARTGKSLDASPSDAMYWCQARAGELTTWLILLAAVEGLRNEAPSGDLDRAAAWSKANFERTLSLLQSDSPLEGGDTGITESVAAYSRSIGDAEPLLMWDEQWVRPSHSPGSADGAPPPSSRPRSIAEATASSGASSGVSSGPPSSRTTSDGSRRASVKPGRALRSWIVTWLAQRLRVAESQIDPRRSFADHGMDSLAAVELAKALSDHLGRSLDETLLWNFANIDALLKYLEAPSAPSVRPSGTPAAAPKPIAKASESDLEDEIDRLEKELSRRS